MGDGWERVMREGERWLQRYTVEDETRSGATFNSSLLHCYACTWQAAVIAEHSHSGL